MPTPCVLLVNDDPVTNLMHEAILSRAELEVRFAVDGRAAIDSCLLQTPDAVVMDIDMPVMNGIDAMQELRALHSAGTLPYIGVVATSAAMDEVRRKQCESAGALAVLAKPITFEKLLDAVRLAIDKTREAQKGSPVNPARQTQAGRSRLPTDRPDAAPR